jgi:hypothetical protein
MNLNELKTLLEVTGFPVAYFQFIETENEPVPEPPFIVFFVTDSENLFGDDTVIKDIEDVDIELYTDKKDINAENKVKEVLKKNNLPYTTSEVYIESQRLYQKTFEVRLI